MKKLFFFFLLLLTVNCQLSTVLAAEPGLNVINDPSTAGNMPDTDFQNWVVYAPGSPEELLQADLSSPNVVVRIHSSWTDIGQQMLGTPTEQSQAAFAWSQALNNLAASGKTVYVEPFNELEQTYERRSPTGELEINTAISRALNFISDLKSSLSPDIKLTSPALDPLNPNFPATFAAFQNFDFIAYHAYTLDAIAKLNSIFPGKKFLLTEVGALKNGTFTYNDQDFINFYCQDGMAAAIQSNPSILAYFMFSFAPGDAKSSWSFNNGNVAKAISGRCNELDLTPTIYPTRIPTARPSPTSRPVVNGELIPPSISNISYANPHYADHQMVGDPNSFTWNRDEVCVTQVTLKKSYESPKTSTTDDQGNTKSEYLPMIVSEIDGTINLNEPYTNSGNRDFTLLTAYHPSIKIREKIMHPELYKQRQTSYTKLGFNPSQRVLTYAEKLFYRWKLYETAALSLDDSDPLNPPHTSASNQVVAWNCVDTIYHALDLTDDRGGEPGPGGCTGMTLAEVLSDLVDEPKVAYELENTPDGLRAKEIGVPGNIKAILEKYFYGGGYDRDFGKPYVRTTRLMYRLVYDNTEVTVPTGPTINEITVHNQNADGSITKKISYRALPLTASMADPNAAPRFFNNLKPANQSNNYPGTICSAGGGGPTVDKPTPISFLAYLKNLFDRIIGLVTLVKTVKVESKMDGNISQNLNRSEQFFADFTPQKDQNQLTNDAKASAGGAENLPLTHPGLSIDKKYDFFKKELTPLCWRQGNCPQNY